MARVSDEKRLRIRPTGVVSKNLTGASTILLSIAACIFLDALMVAKANAKENNKPASTVSDDRIL